MPFSDVHEGEALAAMINGSGAWGPAFANLEAKITSVQMELQAGHGHAWERALRWVP